jgi:hypothetical protein
MTAPLNVHALEHFLQLARRGNWPGSSGGEVRAAKLAAVVVEYVSGLDSEAVDGLIEFIRVARAAPQTAEKLLKEKGGTP